MKPVRDEDLLKRAGDLLRQGAAPDAASTLEAGKRRFIDGIAVRPVRVAVAALAADRLLRRWRAAIERRLRAGIR
jgi:hypothetical protein